MTVSVVDRTKERQLKVLASETTPFEHLECEKLVIYNHARLRTIINDFARTHQLHNAYATCALTGPNIFEGMILQQSAQPQLHDFSIARSRKHVWDYQYLYPHENGSYMFYVCGIPHTILFQYQLLMQSINLHVSRITTRRMALLHAYEYLYGPAYRPAQLGLDLMRHNNMIEEIFTRDLFHRLVNVSPELAQANNKTIPDMLTACGLYVGEFYSTPK